MNLAQRQKNFFLSGKTHDIEYRERQLRSLYHVILQYEERITGALRLELSKSEAEGYMTEVGQVLSEISYTLSHIRRWSRPRRAGAPVSAIFSSSKIYREGYGTVLIISSYCHPFSHSLLPLVSALAAGNCAVIKPSEYAPATAAVISEMLNNNFEERLCAVVSGGEETARTLLEEDFDYVFFSGPRSIGQQVYTDAAKNMIPVTLMLGGKSPCIVEGSADIDLAARRIVWGKFLNAGQSYLAPDYVLVQDSVKHRLIEAMKNYIVEFYGPEPQNNRNYPNIINRMHYDRISEMLSEGTVLAGGEKNEELLKISPTIIENAPFYSKVMIDEIFGPILPIIEFTKLEQIFDHISLYEKPLALYLFTRDKGVEEQVLSRIQFGGGCVNDTLLQAGSPRLSQSGIGGSGLGSFRGHLGFMSMTHEKAVIKKLGRFEIKLRYPPYGELNRLVRRLLK